MAEQAQKQESKKRPQIRAVKLAGEVFFPGAATLGGSSGKLEIDLEGRTAETHKASATLASSGVRVAYEGIYGQQREARACIIPWHMVTRVDVEPEARQ